MENAEVKILEILKQGKDPDLDTDVILATCQIVLHGTPIVGLYVVYETEPKHGMFFVTRTLAHELYHFNITPEADRNEKQFPSGVSGRSLKEYLDFFNR